MDSPKKEPCFWWVYFLAFRVNQREKKITLKNALKKFINPTNKIQNYKIRKGVPWGNKNSSPVFIGVLEERVGFIQMDGINPYSHAVWLSPPKSRFGQADSLGVLSLPPSVVPASNTEAPPSVTAFYGSHIKDIVPTYRKSLQQYFHNLKDNPHLALKVLGISGLMGALIAAFPRHQGLVKAGFVLGLIGSPVKHTIEQFPKLTQSYRLAQEGKSEEAEKTFKPAMEKSIYHLFHAYLKPMTFGVLLAELLSLPESLRELREVQPLAWKDFGKSLFNKKMGIEAFANHGFLNRLCKTVLSKFRITEQALPIRLLDKLYQPLLHAGQRIDTRYLRPLEQGTVLGPVLRRLLK